MGFPTFHKFVVSHCGGDEELTSVVGKYPVCDDCVKRGKTALRGRGAKRNLITRNL